MVCAEGRAKTQGATRGSSQALLTEIFSEGQDQEVARNPGSVSSASVGEKAQGLALAGSVYCCGGACPPPDSSVLLGHQGVYGEWGQG